MTRVEFMVELERALAGFPAKNAEETLAYYSEMLDDRMEEGMTEEQAVLSMGSVEVIRDDLLREMPVRKLVKEKVASKKQKSGLVVALLILGFPIWFPLLVTVLALVAVVYLTFWVGILMLWVTDLALAFTGVACAASAIWNFGSHNIWQAVFYLGVSLIALALSVVLFFVFRSMTRKLFELGKHLVLSVKKLFVKRGNNA